MKKVTLLALTGFLSASVFAQSKYIVKGSIPVGYAAKTVTMGYPDGGKYRTDTASIRGGKFEFKGTIDRPQLAEIDLIMPRPAGKKGHKTDDGGDNASGKNTALFYMEDNISVNFDNAGVGNVTGGGKEEQAYKEFIAESKEKNKSNPSEEVFQQNIADFMSKHPDAYISLDMLEMFAGAMQPKTFEPMLNSLSPRMQNTKKAQAWKKKLNEAKRFDVGQLAVDFTLNDKDGHAISLSSYKGRYVLLDFWASWCGPCRAENPNVLAAYNKYKDKNFQVLSVSIDDNKNAWLKAVAEDKLPWTQVSDLKGANSDVAKLYNIDEIPQNLLIDPTGKIVGRNLRGNDLNKMLAEILK